MNIQISRIPAALPGSNRLWLTDSLENMPSDSFNDHEWNYIEQQFKAEKKQVVINHYGFFSVIVKVEKEEDKEESCFSLEALRREMPEVVNFLNDHSQEGITLSLSNKISTDFLEAAVEGLVLAGYRFDHYKKSQEPKKQQLQKIFILEKDISEEQLVFLSAGLEGTCICRNLVNEPVSFLTALKLSQTIHELGNQAGFGVEIFNKSKIEALKMEGLLAVNQGSELPPTFTVMEYKSPQAVNSKPYVLVGKGVVFDSGGLNLKTVPGSIDNMKSDMGGAAAVIGTLYAISKAKLPIHVVGLIPATDNRPGANALAPGDIIRYVNEKSVEVLNTDAEGRLILADALIYASRYAPELVIDLATLTGSAAMAIGKFGMVAMGTASQDTMASLQTSGQKTHERVVPFPFWKDYGELLKSEVADLTNLGGREGGAITAGKFLEHFTDYPWIHLDIAGPAFLTKKDSYRGFGGTGVGVRLLFHLFSTIAQK